MYDKILKGLKMIYMQEGWSVKGPGTNIIDFNGNAYSVALICSKNYARSHQQVLFFLYEDLCEQLQVEAKDAEAVFAEVTQRMDSCGMKQAVILGEMDQKPLDKRIEIWNNAAIREFISNHKNAGAHIDLSSILLRYQRDSWEVFNVPEESMCKAFVTKKKKFSRSEIHCFVSAWDIQTMDNDTKWKKLWDEAVFYAAKVAREAGIKAPCKYDFSMVILDAEQLRPEFLAWAGNRLERTKVKPFLKKQHQKIVLVNTKQDLSQAESKKKFQFF